jgi:hypothetical protein
VDGVYNIHIFEERLDPYSQCSLRHPFVCILSLKFVTQSETVWALPSWTLQEKDSLLESEESIVGRSRCSNGSVCQSTGQSGSMQPKPHAKAAILHSGITLVFFAVDALFNILLYYEFAASQLLYAPHLQMSPVQIVFPLLLAATKAWHLHGSFGWTFLDTFATATLPCCKLSIAASIPSCSELGVSVSLLHGAQRSMRSGHPCVPEIHACVPDLLALHGAHTSMRWKFTLERNGGDFTSILHMAACSHAAHCRCCGHQPLYKPPACGRSARWGDGALTLPCFWALCSNCCQLFS